MNFLAFILIIQAISSQTCQELDTIKHFNSINAPNQIFYKEFFLKKGDCFDPKEINRQRIRLLQTDYFESINYLFLPKK
jgi:hypothetical protein